MNPPTRIERRHPLENRPVVVRRRANDKLHGHPSRPLRPPRVTRPPLPLGLPRHIHLPPHPLETHQRRRQTLVRRNLGERLEDSATRQGVQQGELRAARGRRLQTITYEEALREKLIVGSPERVADRLMGLQDTLGLDGILCEMNCGTKIPHHQVMRSLQLLCEKVKPQFH